LELFAPQLKKGNEHAGHFGIDRKRRNECICRIDSLQLAAFFLATESARSASSEVEAIGGAVQGAVSCVRINGLQPPNA
jgi:hypothetical protein